MRLRVKLIREWRQAWKWISMQSMLLAGAIQGAWIYIPDFMRASIPPKLVTVCTLLLLALGIAGRLIDQKKPEKPDA